MAPSEEHNLNKDGRGPPNDATYHISRFIRQEDFLSFYPETTEAGPICKTSRDSSDDAI